ncbi:hypothetical protein CVT25_002536 [Psilocybe cyanescens]|uniref:NAD(P)-binding protein n=1 Tax=Psilocybe cyanescens TaxID=93625 RepID=A0A409XUG0_PSICY|nr:hypothetical protein CVT25_002536 [Psilocybe cyanescens]
MKFTLFDFVKAQWTTVPPVPKQDLSRKTVIVTGANTGIGFEAAKHFARMGPGRLILTSRSQEKGNEAVAKIEQETGCKNVEAWVLELADFSSVKAFGERFEKDGGRLDILMENAGLATTELNFTEDGWESSAQVNDMSNTLLALLLLPRMLETAQKHNTYPRIVIATSETHHYIPSLDNYIVDSANFFRKYAHREYLNPPMPKDRYPSTKLLNVFLARALNDRLHRKPVIVNSANPGYCYSSLRRNQSTFGLFMMWLMDLTIGRTADDGSRVFVWAALGAEEKRDELRGAYVSLCQVNEPSDYVVSEDGKIAQDRIWNDLIEELIKIEPKVQKIVKECLTEPVHN